MKTSLVITAVACLSASVSAQTDVFTIDIDAVQSAFTWSGTSDIGAITPDPTNAFVLSGTVEVEIAPGADAMSTGQFLSADLQLTPEFSGIIPNPLSPLFPPVATLSVSGQRVTVTSPPFAIAANGDFTAVVTLSNTAGDITVDALGSVMTSSLIGNPSAPTPFTGTFVLGEYGFDVGGPISANFAFTDPGTGVNGSFNITGTLAGAHNGLYAPTFCAGDGGDQMGCTDCPCGNNAPIGSRGGCLNGVLQSAELVASGGAGVTAGDLHFNLLGGNPGTFGILISGAARAPGGMANPCFGMDTGVQSVVFDGKRCAIVSTRRHGVRPTDANGDIGITTNGWGPPNAPMAGIATQGGFVAGQVRNFQVIYREDPLLQCGRGQNTSNGVTIAFVP